MPKKTIEAKNAPAAIGPYSHACLAGETLYISGQLGIDPNSGEMKKDLTEQVEQALKNLGAILDEADMGYQNIVKTTLFITDMGDFAACNEIYGRYFAENPPARSCFQVVKLPLNGLFEVEAIAVK